MDNIETAAAASLVDRAMSATTESEFNILIGSAHRLDKFVSIEGCKQIWLDKWMSDEYTKRSNNGKE